MNAAEKIGTHKALKITAFVLAMYAVAAYVLLPKIWKHFEHPSSLEFLESAPKVTYTASGIPGDPINIGLIGSQEEIIAAMKAAGWAQADPVTLRSAMHITESVMLRRPYPEAPVSNLYLWGRKQDLSFEREAGRSAKRRDHLRLWRSDQTGKDGRPLWLGSVTFDQSVGVSHYTGQITHHIAPDVDAERDILIADLQRARQLSQTYQATGVGLTWMGRNGGGDWYYTDGKIKIGNIVIARRR